MPEAWVGHTIGELKVRQNYGVNILGIRQDGNLTVEFTPQMHLQGADTILVVGKREDVQKYFQI